MFDQTTALSRRQFLQASVAGSTAFSASLFAAGSDAIKVGLIGCGGRGTGAASQCAKADPGVQIAALADLFPEHITTCRKQLESVARSQMSVTDDQAFVGFDAYRRVLDHGIDLVILATPSGFRATHLDAALQANKHVFAEKSGAVDGPGVRKLLALSKIATAKSLSVVCGLQRRYQPMYQETVSRIQDGIIGDVQQGRCAWLMNSMWERDRQSQWSDTEYQVRNWFYYTWLSGDWPVELLIHNLDAMNWALGSLPLRVSGSGERRKYSEVKHGNIFDHFELTYSYPGNVTITGECGLTKPGQPSEVAETLVGSKGTCKLHAGEAKTAADETFWKFSGPRTDPYQTEQDLLIRGIRNAKPLNNLKDMAESSLTAIMGRMAAYSGAEVTWEQALQSNESLMPGRLEWGPLAVAAVANPKAKPKKPAQPRTNNGEKYALLVGVRNYDKNELKNLKFSEPDITEMSRVLLQSGYRAENVVLMTQSIGAENDRFLPRADEIRRELRLLLKGLSANDSVVIGFAGHGVQFKDETEVYFCPAGTRLSDRKTLVSLTEVYNELEKCPARFKLLISDACRNDPQTVVARSLDSVRLESVTRPQLRPPPGGVAALFSCSTGEQAFEHEDLKHGVFYHFLIKGLQGDADSDGDGIVTLPELEAYLKKRVFDFVRSEYGREQTPDFIGHTKGLVPLVELKK